MSDQPGLRVPDPAHLRALVSQVQALDARLTHLGARVDIFDEAFDQLDPQLEQLGQLARTGADAAEQATLGAMAAQGLAERMRGQLDSTAVLVERHLDGHAPREGDLGGLHERVDRCAEDLEMLRRRVDAWQLMHAEVLRTLDGRISTLTANASCGPLRRRPLRLRLAILLRRVARWLEPQRRS